MTRSASILLLLASLGMPAFAAAQEPPPSPFAPHRRPQPVQAEQAPADEAQGADQADPAAPPAEAQPDTQPTEMEAAPAEADVEGPADAVDPLADDAFAEDAFAGDDAVDPETAQAEGTAEEPTLDPTDVEAVPAADVHEGGEGAHAEGGHEEEAAFDAMEFLATVVNFLLWFALIVLLLRKPLAEFLKNRRVAVVEGLEESKRLKAAAEEKYAEYSQRLEHLDEELEKLRQEMIQAGESERDRIIAEAEARAARMRKDAQFVIDQQMKQLKADLTREAIEAAVAAAEAVLSDQTSAADQQRLANDYLKTLETAVKDGEVRA